MSRPIVCVIKAVLNRPKVRHDMAIVQFATTNHTCPERCGLIRVYK
jgi:hypothetical protein